MIQLVDPVYLKRTKKPLVTKVSVQKQSTKHLRVVFVVLLIVFILWNLWNYIKVTPIVDPDFECLPKNIRDSDLCKAIALVAKSNKIETPSKPPELKAYNDDMLAIKYTSAP